VVETAHGFEGKGSVELGLRAGGHFKDIAVAFFVFGIAVGDIFFATEPRAPGADTSGAVAGRAAEAEPRFFDDFRFFVVEQGACTAEVGLFAIAIVIAAAFAESVQEFTARAKGAVLFFVGGIFVISDDEAVVGASAGEAAHAIGAAGAEEAIAHFLASLADDMSFEALAQGKYAREAGQLFVEEGLSGL
jgi:hypothetical protein